MGKAKFIMLRETASTNTYANTVGALLPSGTIIATANQTAGRGQRGNSWESEPGKSITLTAIIKDTKVKPSEQFMLSEAVSNAIVGVLSEYTSGFSVKWSNDIYHDNDKICGILIEHVISGDTIARTIIGVGLNVNQTKFVSDAPNPVSLAQILGKEVDLNEILHNIGDAIIESTETEETANGVMLGGLAYDEVHSHYLKNLYWKDGELHEFRLPDGTPLTARITDVARDGKMELQDIQGNSSHYYFKEVAFNISK